MARVIRADGNEELDHWIRSLGPRGRRLITVRKQPVGGRLQARENTEPSAEERGQSPDSEDGSGAFVALHGLAGIAGIGPAYRQLPAAPTERETAQMQRAEYAKEADRLLRLVQRIVERVLSDRQNMVHAARAQIVDLAMAIAERVVRKAASSDRGVAGRAVAEALAQVHSRERVRVRLNPSDLEHLCKVDLEVAAGFTSVDRLELVGDSDVEVGGCVVETEMGSIDGRIETQLAQVQRALLEALKAGRVDEPD